MRRTPHDQPAAANPPSGHQHDLRPTGDEPDAQDFTGTAGGEFVQFSPTDELQAVEAGIAKAIA